MDSEKLETILRIYGTRGSVPVSGKEYLKYGGNTNCFVVHTPKGTLLFLDAGSGIINAAKKEFNGQNSVKTYLLFSHMHADHIEGLGLSILPYQTDRKIKLIGLRSLEERLSNYYGDELAPFPVKFNKEYMPGIDFFDIIKINRNGFKVQIDSSTLLTASLQNHKGFGNVINYRLNIGDKIISYTTDFEFDYITDNTPATASERLMFKEKYSGFVKGSDILIAGVPYTKEQYLNNNPNIGGRGHAYIEQVIDIANEANVKKLIITHHHRYHNDEKLTEIEQSAQNYAKDKGYNLKVTFAQEGAEYLLSTSKDFKGFTT